MSKNPAISLKKSSETLSRRKQKNIERAASRPGYTPAGGKPHRKGWPEQQKRSVIFDQPVRGNLAGCFLHQVVVAGVLVEQSLHRADAETAKAEVFSRLPYKHYLLNPISGARVLLDSRREN